MSRIRDIRIVPLEFPLPAGEGYGSSRGLTNRRGGGLVILETEDGVQGIGECWGPPAVSRAYLEMVKPLYVGRSVFAQRGAAQTVLARMYHFGTQNQLIALMGGIDIAAHDAMGKLLNLSVADLIGGRQREHVPVYASGGYFTEADDQAAALARQLEPNAARGFTAFKIKIGRHPVEDAARVALARRIIGDSAAAHCRYQRQLHRGRRAGEHAPHRVIRHPLVRGAARAAGLGRLRQPEDARAGVARHRRGAVQRFRLPPPDRCTAGRRWCSRTLRYAAVSMSRARSASCAPRSICGFRHMSGAPASGLRRRCNSSPHCRTIRTAHTCRSRRWWNTTSGDNALQNDIFVEPLRYADGHLDVPTGPGLGVTLDEAAVRRFSPA